MDSPPPRLQAPAATASAPTTNSYDEVPYESHPYAQTHPSRLATIATLFGLTPPPIEACRVLELGCASGGNLIPMAETFPGSWFVGIDLSARQIGDGERIVRAMGIGNVSLRHANIKEVDEAYGQFDYILCHGVFSWVEERMQDKILEICSERLTPQGVAYVSYNTYPGWHMRGMIRDMMRYHALRFETSAQRVHQARALLDFLAQSARQDGGAYSTLLRNELDALRKQADHYLYHEHLEDVNAPMYFHQFIARAERHQLRYLGEARLSTMLMANFTPDVRKALETVAADQSQAEQYMDFVRNRTFRETLLIHAEQSPQWAIRPEVIQSLHVTSGRSVALDGCDPRSSGAVKYQTPSGMTISTSSPVLKSAMCVLAGCFPGAISFEALNQAVTDVLGEGKDEREALSIALLNTYIGSDLLELHAVPIPAGAAGDKPVALASVRARLAVGETAAANRRHDLFRASEFDVKLLPLLDGSRDRSALLEAIASWVERGETTVQADGRTVTDPVEIRTTLGPVLDRTLSHYAAAGLLV